jgi:hypothetical protein
MTHTLAFKDGEPDERVRRLVDELAAKLERVVGEQPPDAVSLRVVLESLAHARVRCRRR